MLGGALGGFARFHERAAGPRLTAHQLVDGPRGTGRLGQALDLRRRVSVTFLTQTPGERVALAHELLQRQAVQIVGVGWNAHV